MNKSNLAIHLHHMLKTDMPFIPDHTDIIINMEIQHQSIRTITTNITAKLSSNKVVNILISQYHRMQFVDLVRLLQESAPLMGDRVELSLCLQKNLLY